MIIPKNYSNKDVILCREYAIKFMAQQVVQYWNKQKQEKTEDHIQMSQQIVSFSSFRKISLK